MRDLDVAFQQVLEMRTGVADQYVGVSTGWTKMKNDAAPWMHEAEDLLIKFNRRRVRDGSLVKLMEIGDVNQTIQAMSDQGYSAAERQSVWDLREMLDRFFRYMVDDPAYKLGDAQYVFGYVSRVRARQLAGVGDQAWDDTENLLPHHLKFFAEESRKGKLDYREEHMGNIMGRLIRGAMFHKHVRAPWEEMAQTWDQPWIPEDVRAYVGGFLQFVQRGRDPKEDAVMVGARHIFNKLGVPVTEQDMASFSGGMIGTMYRAYLGLRPDVMLREMMQPGMAATKIGYEPIRESIMAFTGPEKESMIRLAIAKGWVEPGVPRGLYAGAFEEQVTQTVGSHPFYTVNTPPAMIEQQNKLAERREAFSRFIDVVPVARERRAQRVGIRRPRPLRRTSGNRSARRRRCGKRHGRRSA